MIEIPMAVAWALLGGIVVGSGSWLMNRTVRGVDEAQEQAALRAETAHDEIVSLKNYVRDRFDELGNRLTAEGRSVTERIHSVETRVTVLEGKAS